MKKLIIGITILLLPFIGFSHDGKDLSEPMPLDALTVTWEGDTLPISDMMYPYEWEEWDRAKKEAAAVYCLAAIVKEGRFPRLSKKDFIAWCERKERSKYPDLLYDADFEELLLLRNNWEKFLDYYVPVVVALMEKYFKKAAISTVGEGFQAIMQKIDFEANWLEKP